MIKNRTWAIVGMLVLLTAMFLRGRATADPSRSTRGETIEFPEGLVGYVEIRQPWTTNTWSEKLERVKLWDQANGAAYVRTDTKNRTWLEAMSVCNPGVSSHKAAAKVVYRVKNRTHGMASIRPVGVVNGQLLGAGILGAGTASAKITISVYNEANDDMVVPQKELFKSDLSNILIATKKDDVNQLIEDASFGSYSLFPLLADNTYRIEIKLWTECSVTSSLPVLGIPAPSGYHARADISRHGPERIGGVRIDYLEFNILPYHADNIRRFRHGL